ncbi:type II secretion system F family protein [Buchananella felis]|uniref:type II secretion system F family protein n=1 Tax=Buchananella felis TaxID=3231492 RepID=UPI0035290E2D
MSLAGLSWQWSWLGAGLGAMFAVGVGLLGLFWSSRRPTLEQRVAPYVGGPTRPVVASGPWGSAVRALGSPVLDRSASLMEHLGSTRQSVNARLRQLGGKRSVDQFRIEQVIWASVALLVGTLVALGAVLWSGFSWVAAAIAVVLAGLGGALARDAWLTREAKARLEQIGAELPDFAELVALAVAAGESLPGALNRVAMVGSGPLAEELRDVVSQARAGVPLATTMREFSDRINLPSLTRFIETALVAMERGTPLAEVLRAQAQDSREESRRALMESGGKREIAMMVPVVFLILPVTVIFVLFPGLSVMSLGL